MSCSVAGDKMEDLHFIDSDAKDTDDEALDSSRSGCFCCSSCSPVFGVGVRGEALFGGGSLTHGAACHRLSSVLQWPNDICFS